MVGVRSTFWPEILLVPPLLCLFGYIKEQNLSTIGATVWSSPLVFLGQETMVKESLPGWFQRGPQEGLVHINVGGLKRSLCSNTLKKFPDTRLGKLLACDSEEDILQVRPSQEFLDLTC